MLNDIINNKCLRTLYENEYCNYAIVTDNFKIRSDFQ